MMNTEIPGLLFYPEIFNSEIEEKLILEIDSKEWSNKLKRRTQHYGYIYDYQSSDILDSAEEFPPLLNALADYLVSIKVFKKKPNQCIVNEYYRNQGINPHIDRKIFGDTIVSISLGDNTIMNFSLGEKEIPIFLPQRSMILLQGEARQKWKHSISSNVTYLHREVKITKPQEYRRISITFREYIQKDNS